jgi:hypothetical protein
MSALVSKLAILSHILDNFFNMKIPQVAPIVHDKPITPSIAVSSSDMVLLASR